MALVVVPQILRKPEVVETLGAPEIYCDLALVRDHAEVVRIVLCTARDSGILDVTAKLFMPRAGFCRSLRWAATDFLLPAGVH
jgi:hypothetical protein